MAACCGQGNGPSEIPHKAQNSWPSISVSHEELCMTQLETVQT
jgi:hypothetical protein